MDVTYLQNNADTLIEHMRMRSSCSRSKCHRSIQVSFLLGHSSVETTMVLMRSDLRGSCYSAVYL